MSRGGGVPSRPLLVCLALVPPPPAAAAAASLVSLQLEPPPPRPMHAQADDRRDRGAGAALLRRASTASFLRVLARPAEVARPVEAPPEQ